MTTSNDDRGTGTKFASGRFHGQIDERALGRAEDRARSASPRTSGADGRERGRDDDAARGRSGGDAAAAIRRAEDAAVAVASGLGGPFAAKAVAKAAKKAEKLEARAAKRADRSPAAKLALGILGAAQIGLALAAIVDITRKRPEQIHGPKWFWYAAQGINWVGPIAYFMAGRKIGA